MTLLDKIDEYEYGEPIFIAELAADGKYSYNSIKSMLSKYVKKGFLKRYCQGVYFRYQKTEFGDSCIDFDKLLERKYIKNGDEDVFGYYSGITLLNQCGLTTQVPNTREIVSNNETSIKRTVNLSGHEVIVRKSRFKIDKDNYKYYQFMNIMRYLSDYQIDDFNERLSFIYKVWELDNTKFKEIAKKQSYYVKNNIRRFNYYNEFAQQQGTI